MTSAHSALRYPDADAGLVRATSFTRALRTKPLWAVAGVVLGAAAGVAALAVIPAQYSSTATVLVGRGVVTLTSQGSTSTGVDTQTAAQIASSGNVAQVALPLIGGGVTQHTALHSLTVGTPTAAGTITLTYVARSAARAQGGAEAFARAYVAVEQAQYQATLSAALASVDRQLGAVQAGGSRAQLTARNAQLTALAGQRAALAAATVDAGRIISPAPLPAAKTGLPGWLYVVAGAVIGLLAGWSLAVLRDRGDDRLRDRSDVEAVGVPVLGHLAARGRGAAEVTARLSLAVAAAGARTLLVSEMPGTAGGANRLLRLLQDADPRVRELEQAPPRVGNLLAGSDGVRTMLLEKSVGGLLVMTSGPIAGDPESLLPAAAADGVIVVARPGRLRGAALVRAARDLERTGGRLLGLVLVSGP